MKGDLKSTGSASLHAICGKKAMVLHLVTGVHLHEGDPMKILRYRKPSMNQILGITKMKRKVKHELGISQVEAWTKPSRVKQRVKQHVGLYSPEMRVIRQTSQGKFPSFLGLFGKK